MIHNIDWYNIYSRYSKQKKSLTSTGRMKNTQNKNYPDNSFLKTTKSSRSSGTLMLMTSKKQIHILIQL